MCMLTYYPAGMAEVDTEALDNGATWNRDGHGFAIVDGNRIIVEHNMKPDALIDRFAMLRSKYPDGPALFHSRWGTSGERSTLNCHPFKVTRDTVLAHNGVMRMDLPKGDPRCDTRIVAEEIIEQWDILTTAQREEKFAEWLTPANKVLVLTIDPRYRSNVFLFNEKAGVWDGGIWYSNTDYQPYVPTLGKKTSTALDSREKVISCIYCQCETPEDLSVCINCQGCFLCGNGYGDQWCKCY